jgi:putative addiction module component (TIGR02574 family)
MGDAARKPAPENQGIDPLEEGDAWEAEIDRRIEEVRTGRVQLVPWDDMVAELKAKYGWD